MATNKQKEYKDYLRIDLKPGGKDLKTYVIKQAAVETEKQGRAISSTKYIQMLIENDMKAHEGKRSRRQDIIDMLNRLEDKDLKTIEDIADAMLHRCNT